MWTSLREARPNFDIVLDDRESMIDNICPNLTKEQTIEANKICELGWTLARTIVAGLLSFQVFGESGVEMCWT